MRVAFACILLLVAACSETAAPEGDPPRTINWETLLPEGEIALVDQLYEEYFAELDSKLQSQQPMSLFDAGKEGGYGAIEEGSELDYMPQLGTFNVVEDLDGVRVRLPGFVTPFEFSESGKVTEFLFVPYFGACIHTPPPPPNQIVYVTAKKPQDLGNQWDAIWVVGILRTQSNMNDLGNAAYTLEIESWEAYQI